MVNFEFSDYLQLIDWTGRQIRGGKTGTISQEAQPLIAQLDVNKDEWFNTMELESRHILSCHH